MKTLSRQFIFLLLFAILISNIISCKKSSNNSAVNSFTWSYGATNYQANVNAAYLTGLSSTPIIIGGTGTSVFHPNVGPQISVVSLNVGSYNFLTSPNSMYYVDDLGNPQGATSGSVNITSNSNNLLSGNFSCTLTNSILLTGNFTNVPINQ